MPTPPTLIAPGLDRIRIPDDIRTSPVFQSLLAKNVMTFNDILHFDERHNSQDGSFYLIMQRDGNLVIYNKNNHAVWATRTNGSGATNAVMQEDGNFVLYDAHNHPIWATGTDGNPESILVLQNDGNMGIYNHERILWTSKQPAPIPPQPDPVPQSLSFADTITFSDGIAIGGRFALTLNSTGDFTFSGYMHDAGWDGYWYSIVAVIVTPEGKAYAFEQKGNAEGTVNALPFGTPNRDSDWNTITNNPAIAQDWNSIAKGTFSWKAHAQDSFFGGLNNMVQDAINEALQKLKDKGVEIGVSAIITLLAA